MAKYRSLSQGERDSIRQLEERLGSKGIRTLMVSEDQEQSKPERVRILSNRRLANLSQGTGKLTESEAARLELLAKNARAIEQLQKRGEKLGKKDFQTNRAIRTWIEHGKGKSSPRSRTANELRAIKALRFLGVDVGAGIFYLKGITA